MSGVSPQDMQSGDRTDGGVWFARGRKLGLGVLIAFTVKGIFTTTMILTTLFAAADGSSGEMLPHVLLWTVACIGGFCLLGGWRDVRRRDAKVRTR